MRGPLEIRTVRHPDQEIVVCRSANIFFPAHVANAPIPFGVGPADLLSAIDGGVIRDQNIKIAVSLREDRLDGGRKEVGTIADGQSDRNFAHADLPCCLDLVSRNVLPGQARGA